MIIERTELFSWRSAYETVLWRVRKRFVTASSSVGGES